MKSWYQHVFVSTTAAGKKLRIVGSIVVSMLIVMFILTAGVTASSPSSPDITVTYYACVTNSTGAIKIVSATTTCPTGTHKIHWNQQGPQGPQGPQGIQGPPGITAGYTGIFTSLDNLSSNLVAIVATTTVASGHYFITAQTTALPATGDYIGCEVGTANTGPSGHYIAYTGGASEGSQSL